MIKNILNTTWQASENYLQIGHKTQCRIHYVGKERKIAYVGCEETPWKVGKVIARVSCALIVPYMLAYVVSRIFRKTCSYEVYTKDTSYQPSYAPALKLSEIGVDGDTPVTRAISANQPDRLAYLISLGANLNQRARNGNMPLTEALIRKNFTIIKLLKDAGADVPLAIGKGEMWLSAAFAMNNRKLLEVLIRDLGVDINQVMRDGSTYLIEAVKEKNFKKMRLLRDLGADMNKAGSDGDTPLLTAITCASNDPKSVKMVQTLVRYGADVEGRGSSGETPMTWSVFCNQPAIIKALCALHANVNKPAGNGEPPLARAILHEIPGMATLLKELGANEQAARRIVDKKFTAHVWGIKGRSRVAIAAARSTMDATLERYSAEFNFEGFGRYHAMHKLYEYTDKFFRHYANDPLVSQIKAHQLAIQLAIWNAYRNTPTYQNTMCSIRFDSPVVLLGGCEGHVIHIVIFRGKLVVINRGLGSEAQPHAATVYHLDTAQMSEKMYDELTKIHPDIESFNAMIANRKELTQLEAGYQHKIQEIDMCTVANGKVVFGVLCCLFSDDVIGRYIYKKFTEYMREEEYKKFSAANNPPDPDDVELLQEIIAKREAKAQKRACALNVNDGEREERAP